MKHNNDNTATVASIEDVAEAPVPSYLWAMVGNLQGGYLFMTDGEWSQAA